MISEVVAAIAYRKNLSQVVWIGCLESCEQRVESGDDKQYLLENLC